MRAVLITLPPPGEGDLPCVAGKSIAQRQLLFARECGCQMVIAHGVGASPDAIALRYAAEKAGMRYQMISSAHALPGAIGDNDSLLVLQPHMLPEAKAALDLLQAEGNRMLVVSAGPGTTAGFERIDLDRAWGGALTMPGCWLASLSSLPEDYAPHAALLRIALQQRLPEARLADDLLDDGRWMVVVDENAASARENTWLRSHLGEEPPLAVSRWLARQAVGLGGPWLLERRFSRAVLLALAVLFLGGALAAASYERPVLGFTLVALSVPVLEAFLALSRLAGAPFGSIRRWPWLRRAVDAVLLVIGFFAIDSLGHRAAFPPLVLVVTLMLLDRSGVRAIIEPLRDRGVIAIGIAALAAITTPEVAIMFAASLILLAKLASSGRDGG